MSGDSHHQPPTPGYDNPSRNKGDLYDEAKGHPRGGQHAGRQHNEGQHQQRPRPNVPIGHASDKKLGSKPPERKPPLE